jgi:hypothetical protein
LAKLTATSYSAATDASGWETRLHRNIAEALPYIVAGLPPQAATA